MRLNFLDWLRGWLILPVPIKDAFRTEGYEEPHAARCVRSPFPSAAIPVFYPRGGPP